MTGAGETEERAWLAYPRAMIAPLYHDLDFQIRRRRGLARDH